jgi:hypothetical protein
MPLGSLALLLAQSGVPADVGAPPTTDRTDQLPAAPTVNAPQQAPAAPPSAPQQVPAAPPATAAPSATVPRSAPPSGFTPISAPPSGFAPMSASPPQTAQVPPHPERSTSLKGAVAASYQRIYDVPIFAGGITFGVGPRKRDRTLFLVVDLDHGVTERGLTTWDGRMLFSPEWSFDRLRLGFGVGAGYFQIARVTNSGNLSSFTLLCGELHASVDLVDTSDSGAFFLAAAFHVDSHFPAVWGPTASLGFRTDDL